jgi:hypothetical protein
VVAVPLVVLIAVGRSELSQVTVWVTEPGSLVAVRLPSLS